MVINLSLLDGYVMVLRVPLQKMFIKKGYHVTEATVLTNSNHPVSLFSEIHSSKEKKLYIHQCYYFFCHGACSCTL